MNFHFTAKSSNVKTGPMPVSTSSKSFCPVACPFKGNGCYAEGGKLGLFWGKVTDGTAKNVVDFESLLGTIKALPEGTLWRHNQAGDLPGDGVNLDVQSVHALAMANEGRRGFTYTHYVPTHENFRSIHSANALGFTVNVSGNSVEHADELKKTGLPVVCVLPIGACPSKGGAKSFKSPGGNTVTVCPAVYRDDVTCKSCGLCQKGNRSAIVGFPAHGNGAKKLDLMLKVNQ